MIKILNILFLKSFIYWIQTIKQNIRQNKHLIHNYLGFKFGAQTNTNSGSVFGAPRGPFGTPAGEKTVHQTPSKLATGSKKAEYLGQIKALNLQV